MPTLAPISSGCRPASFLFFLVLVLISLSASGASAHLSLIRQGSESPGAYEAGDRYGQAVATGDFNGDGIEDLAMGSPSEDVDGDADAGAVIVLWGNSLGLDPAGAQLWTEAVITGGAGTVGGQFGYALAAADFDHDGYDDLAVGNPGGDQAGGDTGVVYLLQGTSGGLAKWFDLTQADAGGALEAGDRFGQSLAVGNFDGDGEPYIDLAVGSPGENGASGAVFWFLSNVLGPLGPSGIFVQSDFGPSDAAGDQFGFSLASGNFIGGPEDDLAVAAPFKNVVGELNHGYVLQIPGTAAGLAVGSYPSLSALSVGLMEPNAYFGWALAVGDLRPTTGGYESLAVGEPGRTVAGNANAGRVIVYEGAISGVNTTTEIVLDQNDAGGNVEVGDFFGAALAAGRFWSDDGWDDLAVGSFNDGLGFTSAAGQVNIFNGGPSGPGSHGWSGFNQGTLNDAVNGGDELGYAVAFGALDGTGNGHLVVGAPGNDGDRGMVHIIAPWRQAYGLSSRQSVVYDCSDRLIFSQRPYDQVFIASTTKIMTVLIGCERIQAGLIDPSDEYIVPAWVANQIGGSQVPLIGGEKINFWDLLNVCLHLSGNDAAHALADWMAAGPQGGDPAVSVAAFMAEMNQRAADIGMPNTHFNNPNGFEQEVVTGDLGDHYSTPVDMARLSQFAMDNPLFNGIARQTTYGMIRQFAIPGVPGIYQEAPFTFNTFYSGVIQNQAQPATGIKGGFTPAAQVTGCFSAENDFGTTWVAGTYGTPNDLGFMTWSTDAATLLQLGGQSVTCGVFAGWAEQFIPYYPVWSNISAAAGALSGGAAEIAWAEPGDFNLHFEPWTGADQILADLTVQHVVELELQPDEEARMGIAPFDGHEGVTLLNMGSRDVTVEFSNSAISQQVVLSLPPGEPQTIPPVEIPRRVGQTEIFVLHDPLAREPANLTVELTYPIDLSFVDGVPSQFDVTLFRPDGVPTRSSLSFQVAGRSEREDASLAMSVVPFGSEATSAPIADPRSSAGSVLELRPAYPNPSGGDRTLIRFDLYQQASVDVTVYDLRGRRVQTLESRSLLPGRHQMMWDGRDISGRAVADGVYLYRVSAEGHPPQSGKISVVR